MRLRDCREGEIGDGARPEDEAVSRAAELGLHCVGALRVGLGVVSAFQGEGPHNFPGYWTVPPVVVGGAKESLVDGPADELAGRLALEPELVLVPRRAPPVLVVGVMLVQLDADGRPGGLSLPA
jgi:hypothetical protein